MLNKTLERDLKSLKKIYKDNNDSIYKGDVGNSSIEVEESYDKFTSYIYKSETLRDKDFNQLINFLDQI